MLQPLSSADVRGHWFNKKKKKKFFTTWMFLIFVKYTCFKKVKAEAEEKFRNFMLRSAGCSLLRAKGFFCNSEVLRRPKDR